MQRSNEWRAYGPYQHGNRWRVALVRGSGAARKTRYETFDAREQAEAALIGARDEAQGITVKQAVEKFLAYKRTKDLADATIDNYEFRLRRLLNLAKNGERPLRYIRGRGADLYAQSVRGAGDTHINGLNVGRMWGAWLVKQRLLKANPFAEVEAVGRKRHGSTKARLSLDESRRLEAYCFAHRDNPDCVLTYGYLMLGKRASELVRVTPRDLDDNGWLLHIRKAKSTASVKAIPVPVELRDMLLALAAGKASDVPLFLNLEGEPMTRYVARDRVKAVCKAAGVTVLPPQALRRTFTDNASRQGVALRSIAEMTGHKSEAVTKRSYMDEGVAEGAAVERNLRVIAGGKR